MARPKITSTLKGALGETYYKELCSQRGWAYCSLETLHNCGNLGSVVFKMGFDRIHVDIPESIRQEVTRIARPSNRSSGNPSFVFDYLACKVGRVDSSSVCRPKSDDFCWAEVKTGLGIFSDNQYRTLSEIRLPIAVFHIEDVLAKPTYVDMDWAVMSGKEFARQLSRGGNYKDDDRSDYHSSTKSNTGSNNWGRKYEKNRSNGYNPKNTGIVARYGGMCEVCDKRIIAGRDRVTQDDSGDWIHARCA